MKFIIPSHTELNKAVQPRKETKNDQNRHTSPTQENGDKTAIKRRLMSKKRHLKTAAQPRRDPERTTTQRKTTMTHQAETETLKT